MLSWFTRTFATLKPDNAKFPRAIAEASIKFLELLESKVTKYGPMDLASCKPFFSFKGPKLAAQWTAGNRKSHEINAYWYLLNAKCCRM